MTPEVLDDGVDPGIRVISSTVSIPIWPSSRR
jgi:hypothetical protein